MQPELPMEQAVRGVQLTAFYEPGYGWTLVVHARREGGRWDERSRYERLVRDELFDVSLEELGRRLGLGG